MFEQPPEADGVALRIAGSSNGIEGEANAEKPPDGPVRDSVTEEVEEEPGYDHGGEGCGFRLGGSCKGECDTGGDNSSNLNYISSDDRKAAEDLSLRKGLGGAHVCCRLSGREY